MGPVPRRTLVDQVSTALLDLIAEEALSPGDPMPATGELAKRFDVSVVVVREAIAQLAGGGILSRRQGRESIVSVPGSEIVADTLAMHAHHDKIPSEDFLICRAALELEAASLAACRGDASSRSARLEPALAKMVSAKSRKAFNEADIALHISIAELSGNRALTVILRSLHEVIRREIVRRTRSSSRQSQSVRDHEEVVRAIIAGDSSAARAAMAEHFDAALPGFALAHLSGNLREQ